MKITRSYIKEQVRVYQSIFQLKDWTIKISWVVDQDAPAAQVVAEPAYKNAQLGFNLDELTSKKLVRESIVHEMWHIILSPYTKIAKKLCDKPSRRVLEEMEERLVTDIEMWDFWREIE